MKIKKFFCLIFFIFFAKINYLKAQEINLDNKYIPLKDFIILKYDLFLKDNLSGVFEGGGMFGVLYQELKYDVKINEENLIQLSIHGIMDKKRYSNKKYYPKLSDCNVIRNKVFINKYGYSFLKQSLNYSVNEDNLTEVIKDKILNISSLDESLKNRIIENTVIKIEVIHPKDDKNISCSGKLISAELK